MKTASLKNDFLYDSALGSFSIEKYVFGMRSPSPVSDNLRFMYSLLPLELIVQGNAVFACERSAIRVEPGTEIGLNMGNGNELYAMTFFPDEKEFLAKLKSSNADFFDGLEGRDKAEWEAVKDKAPGYFIEGERNAERVVRKPGVIIAPPHSRFNEMVGNGWHFMYSRGSIGLGVGTDVLFRPRAEEAPHKHMITIETYVNLAGEMEYEVEGKPLRLGKDKILVAEPRQDVHTRKAVTAAPYAGITLQFPSIPGDKYTPQGERISR